MLYIFVVQKPGHSFIKIEDFTEHVALLKAEKDAKFKEEFELVNVDAPFTQHAAKQLCNKAKNRYKNIIPCERSYFAPWQVASILFQMTIHEWC